MWAIPFTVVSTPADRKERTSRSASCSVHSPRSALQIPTFPNRPAQGSRAGTNSLTHRMASPANSRAAFEYLIAWPKSIEGAHRVGQQSARVPSRAAPIGVRKDQHRIGLGQIADCIKSPSRRQPLYQSLGMNGPRRP